MAARIKKIALIVNSPTDQGGDTLEQSLAEGGNQADVFDVHTVRQTGGGFEIDRGDGFKALDASGYDVVARVIKGAVSGDTEKSWNLQGFFEAAGAIPHIGVQAARTVTDKILCRAVLEQNALPLSPAVIVALEDMRDRDILQQSIEQLGVPPYAVRKSLGSGNKCLAIAYSAAQALEIADRYRDPGGIKPVRRGALIHTLPPAMSVEAARKYGLADVSDIEKRSHHFRVVIVDGKIFSANVCYSQPGQFGLNPAQGADFHAVSPDLLPEGALALAESAAATLKLRVAAVDMALDAELQPQILDMNASPDLSQVNHHGQSLKQAFAVSIQNTTPPAPSADSQPVPDILRLEY